MKNKPDNDPDVRKSRGTWIRLPAGWMHWMPFLLLLPACTPKTMPRTTQPKTTAFDWQGHRGCRGLLPENTIPAFEKAVELGVSTLELDLAVSRDSQLVVSHEPWMSAEICSHPDGSPVTDGEEKQRNLYQMNYAEIRRYDCGKRCHPRFVGQKAMPAVKPLLKDVFVQIDHFCRKNHYDLPNYNVEIKSDPSLDNTFAPPPAEFARMLIGLLQEHGMRARTCIQSFDVRALEAVRKLDAKVTVAYLIENEDDLDVNLQKLSFIPDVYSPAWQLVTPELVSRVHNYEMKLIPWTVNEINAMKKLRTLGVDGLITDYPDKIREVLGAKQ